MTATTWAAAAGTAAAGRSGAAAAAARADRAGNAAATVTMSGAKAQYATTVAAPVWHTPSRVRFRTRAAHALTRHGDVRAAGTALLPQTVNAALYVMRCTVQRSCLFCTPVHPCPASIRSRGGDLLRGTRNRGVATRRAASY